MTKKILDHFKKVDKILFEASKKYGGVEIIVARNTKDYFVSLCDEIISQQLSKRVGDVIFDRFKKLFPNENISAKGIFRLKQEDLRATGMSNSKAGFIMDLSRKICKREVELEGLVYLDNEEIIKELTKIKGIGPWTAEMFLMFTLGREDVFSHGDLGLRNAIKKLYNLEDTTKEYIEELSMKWSPYRTYACRVLWRSLDNE